MKVRVEVPEFEKGLELDLPGVGLVKNGTTVDMDKDQLAAYEARVGRKPNEKSPDRTPVDEEPTPEKAEEGGK